MSRHPFMWPRLAAAVTVSKPEYRRSPSVVRGSWLRGAQMNYSQTNIFWDKWATFGSWRNCHRFWEVRLTFSGYLSWGKHTSFQTPQARQNSQGMLQLGFS